jgi:diguanylate cyclase (GGDEF)-like protein
VAEKIRASVALPYWLTVSRHAQADDIVEHHCSASIGVVMFADHDASHADILKRADVAMYPAKDAGRNTIRFDSI